MLNKLLKYDLKYMVKNMSVFYILALFFGVMTRILFSLNETVIVNIISQISVGCMFAMVVNILINTMMRSWIRFRDSIYKDEAYLTHTLPVTKNDIYNSKFIQTLIFFIVGFLIILVSLFITYYTKDRWLMLTGLIGTITTGLEINTTLFVISFILIIFLEIFNAIQCGFLGIILGYKRNNGKIGFSVFFGLIAYLLSQSMVLLLMFIVGLFNSSIMNLFKSNILLDANSFKLLVVLSIIFYLIIILLMSMICKKEFNKGVNIE